MQAWYVSRLRHLRGFSNLAARQARKERGPKDAIEEDLLRRDTQDIAVLDNDIQNGSVTGNGRDEPAYTEEEPAERDLTPDDVRPPFLDAFTKVPGDARTHRSRRYGNKPLPLSPSMDPVFVAARNKWKMKKGLPPKPDAMTPFQRKLYSNPFAKALATPVRETVFTDSHLPRFFLLPLDLRRAPQPPHAPTWIPSRLWAQTTGAGAEVSRGQPQTYIDLTRLTMDILNRQSSRAKDSVASVGISNWFTRSMRRDLEVLPELGAFVQDLLRKSVLQSLGWPVQHPNAKLIERCDDSAYGIRDREDGGEDVACVLYTVPMDAPHVEALTERVDRDVLEAEFLGRKVRQIQYSTFGRIPKDDKTPRTPFPSPIQNAAAVYPPFRYPTVQDRTGKLVPVYGLYDMLGEEGLKSLLEGTAFEDARCLLLRGGGGDARSLKAQMALLRLLHFTSRNLKVRVEVEEAQNK